MYLMLFVLLMGVCICMGLVVRALYVAREELLRARDGMYKARVVLERPEVERALAAIEVDTRKLRKLLK